ncbi:DUF1634 domain-containing protein [Acidianus sp. RZ1]|uniref:DUF1634 domain-containing protein n=1 Tax=Acidianus sp. RZ1 TaxID=1540082 RepID=UPI0014919DD1|nr:DUF1634 domain-containing protein [Acidianus sp. RZ1]NON62259.1 DUF1634 domain-containing protein [Acidianus sp. RZ1]
MDINDVIGLSLRIGVIVSVILIATGSLLTFVEHGSNGYSVSELLSRTSVVNSSTASFNFIVKSVSQFTGLGLIYLGLVVLIATPVIRVMLSVLYFALDKNLLYTIVTAIVLFNLLIAIFVIPIFVVHN